MSTIDCCLFCLRCRGSITSEFCTYGLAHEFPTPPPPPPIKKRDAKLCVVCSLHPGNPASQTNGCAHQYLTASPPKG
jgi:hypothetical protein